MIKTISYLLLSLLILSCSQKSNSQFFENCNCEKIDLSDGITFTDTLEHFSLKYPDSSWLPIRHYMDGNGITGMDSINGHIGIVGISEMEKDIPWPSQKEQQKEIFDKYNVIENGQFKFKEQDCFWNLVEFNDDPLPINTLYITIEHPTENRFYTINLSVDQGVNMRNRICQLESFLENFNMK